MTMLIIEIATATGATETTAADSTPTLGALLGEAVGREAIVHDCVYYRRPAFGCPASGDWPTRHRRNTERTMRNATAAPPAASTASSGSAG